MALFETLYSFESYLHSQWILRIYQCCLKLLFPKTMNLAFYGSKDYTCIKLFAVVESLLWASLIYLSWALSKILIFEASYSWEFSSIYIWLF